MSLATTLLVYGGGVAVVGPAVLRRLTRSGTAPRLGVLAWVVTVASALAAWMAAAVVFVIEHATVWRHSDEAIRACYAVFGMPVHPYDHPAGRLVTFALAILVAVAAGALGWRSVRMLLLMRQRTRAHARAVRMVGRRMPGLPAVVLDAPHPQAYAVPGRPDTIVVTTGALAALTDDQLAAVLAHERAHLSGRHGVLSAALTGVAAMAPRLGVLRHGSAEVGRLLEMCADDAAAREHGREPLLGGLLAIVEAGARTPAGALGAASTAVLARAQRLAAPAGAMRRVTTRTALLGVILTTVGGLVTAAACVLFCVSVF
ncbi:M56 family metallopeptidase [Nocardia cyriacigeorgica]|uniref:Heat shock protein HtpX n=1 Tax=Nocardia cyriacigeorgica TaxID=135487 RepID=A0A4U8W1B8_9NOCA|nr:M56 family metallopeptidase [Nocardia cyriacigeorgica]MBF6096593.1 M56 family metallopeptidase [Nocardia cyriacigeorgica]MBF6162539.1 M56 family metallopeptidase [Nocardia cyriacigeorgica]MBF6201477.1 M56 family metallopeptidase [Nocardia cyriacigeorgica]MBF6317107.1 M56 family metallopeptidase [Nocardia cyriacigeorgica]MBF6514086.1 M56 family metallopeptidase [Nocardia cyriacigeorgica]